MSHREGKRPPRRPDNKGRRKPPPPESTGSEARYFEERSAAGEAVRVVMVDGGSVSGIVRGADREMLVVKPEIGDAIRVRKSGIRYIEEPGSPEG